eukprot:m.1342241 g.1342241  ORF g.1342241 m.1342241 type:complete len:428 (+) comp24898_c1_seq20:493-1776(+)
MIDSPEGSGGFSEDELDDTHAYDSSTKVVKPSRHNSRSPNNSKTPPPRHAHTQGCELGRGPTAAVSPHAQQLYDSITRKLLDGGSRGNTDTGVVHQAPAQSTPRGSTETMPAGTPPISHAQRRASDFTKPYHPAYDSFDELDDPETRLLLGLTPSSRPSTLNDILAASMHASPVGSDVESSWDTGSTVVSTSGSPAVAMNDGDVSPVPFTDTPPHVPPPAVGTPPHLIGSAGDARARTRGVAGGVAAVVRITTDPDGTDDTDVNAPLLPGETAWTEADESDVLGSEYRRLFPPASPHTSCCCRALVFVQAPVRLALLIAVPTVHVEEYTQHLLWSKRLVLLQVLVSVPLVVAVYSNDAFGNRSSDNVKSLSGIPDGMFMFLLPSPRDQHRREATTMAVLLPRGGLPTPISTLACSCMASTDQCTARF